MVQLYDFYHSCAISPTLGERLSWTFFFQHIEVREDLDSINSSTAWIPCTLH